VHLPALHLASAAAAGWALAALARLVLGYAATTGQGLDAPDLGTQLASFVTQVDAGRSAAVAVALAALTATLAAGATAMLSARLLTLLAGGALVADVLARDVRGDAGGGAVQAALVLHAAGAAVWVGGLAALVVLARGLEGSLADVAVRYAWPAAGGFVLVAVSGVVVTWPRLGSAGGLGTGYGAVVVAKLLMLVALGVLGAMHRRRVLPQVAAGSPHALLRAGTVELVVAITAIGLSAALASTEPPALTAPLAAATLAGHAGH
jgi:putative copper resistance protein D